MNTVVQLGIDAANQNRQAALVAQARQLIETIVSSKASIAYYESLKKTQQEALLKLSHQDVTYADVVGEAAPTSPNASQATILVAIKESNEKKQSAVKLASLAAINQIAGYDASIASVNKSIAEINKELI